MKKRCTNCKRLRSEKNLKVAFFRRKEKLEKDHRLSEQVFRCKETSGCMLAENKSM